MLLSAACEVIVHTCDQLCEITELANESNEEKGKEEETKELFSSHLSQEFLSAASAEFSQRQDTRFQVNSVFNDIPISFPDLPPERNVCIYRVA